jgi:hypothetical protein
MSDHIELDVDEVPIASAEALTAKRSTGTTSGFPEDFVVIESDDGPVKVHVRGLSRHEVLHVQAQKGVAAVEQMTVSLGMIAPKMTPEQVKAWQKYSVGAELDKVTERIGQLSGMLQGSRKAAIREMLADPGVEFRDDAGEGPVDDEGANARGDVQ